MFYTNKDTVKVKVGNTFIGGDAPVTVQSMLCVPAHDIKGNVYKQGNSKGKSWEFVYWRG